MNANQSNKDRRKRKPVAMRREHRAAFFFLLPWFAGLLAFTLGPILASLFLSFTDYSLFTPPKWIGLDNYVLMFFNDQRFWKAAQVTFTYVFVSVPLVILFALGLALLLNSGMRFLSVYRALFYLPSLMGSSVAISLLWRQVFGDLGTVNRMLGLVGIQGPRWFGNADFTIVTLIVLNVWTFGSAMIIFLAGLRQIPRDLYEASYVDGAGPLRRFFSITLPLMTPIVLLNTILNTISAFKAFTPAYVLSHGTGGPLDATLFYTLYLYQKGFAFFQMGYASALAWILLLVIAAITVGVLRSSRHWVYYADNKDEGR
jgi:multiple sugar transport system permease protein